MTNKTKKTKKQIPKKQKPKPKTPFGDTGAIVGRRVGNMFGFGGGSGIGRWLGTGIGSIFGSGDYQVVGNAPGYNVLMNEQIPKFSSSDRTNIVCHREFLGDINGTTAFTNNTYPLNPGVFKTFPWLSSIAANYQEYKFHGLIFEFRPLITDFVTSGAPGVVVFATNYNADKPPYTSKIQMENSEYAVSVKPTNSLLHGVECDVSQTPLSQSYVRTGPVPAGQDLRLYDLGLTQFATQANPTQLLGELWVSYCVEFFKPILPENPGGQITSAKAARSSITPASPLGTVGVYIKGNADLIIGPLALTFSSAPDHYYLVTLVWAGTVAVAVDTPALSFDGLEFVSTFYGTGGSTIIAPVPGLLATRLSLQFYVKTTITTSRFVGITFGNTGVFPTGSTTLDITISEVDSDVSL